MDSFKKLLFCDFQKCFYEYHCIAFLKTVTFDKKILNKQEAMQEREEVFNTKI